MRKQKLNYLFLLIGCFITQVAFAQSDIVENLTKEVESLKQHLLVEQGRVDYLKEALDLKNDKVKLTQDSVTITLTRVTGNSVEETILVQGLMVYHGTQPRNLQFAAQQSVDPKGNTLQSYNAFHPKNLNKDIFIQKAEKEIAYGFVVKFTEVDEKIPVLSLLRLQIYGSKPGSTVNFNFKGVDVTWDPH